MSAHDRMLLEVYEEQLKAREPNQGMPGRPGLLPTPENEAAMKRLEELYGACE